MTDVKGSGEAVEEMLPLTLSFWVNDGHQVALQTVQELVRVWEEIQFISI